MGCVPPIKIAGAPRERDVPDHGQWVASLVKGVEGVTKAADGEQWLRDLARQAAEEGLGDVPFESGIGSDDSEYMRAIYPDWDELMQASREAADRAMAEADDAPTLRSEDSS